MLKIWVFLSYHLIASALFSPPPYCRSLVFLFVLAHKAPLIYMLLFFPSLSPIFTVSFVTLLSSIRRQCRFQRMVTSRSNQPPPRIGRREEKKGWLERVVRTERENKSTIFFFWSCSFTAYIVFSFISVSTLKKEEPKLTKRFFCCFWCCSKQKERDLCNSADQKVLLWKDSPALFFLFFFLPSQRSQERRKRWSALHWLMLFAVILSSWSCSAWAEASNATQSCCRTCWSLAHSPCSYLSLSLSNITLFSLPQLFFFFFLGLLADAWMLNHPRAVIGIVKDCF